jgi:protein-tyrosine-phosphatase
LNRKQLIARREISSRTYHWWITSLSERYGRKRGLLRHYLARTVHVLGGYRRFKNIKFDGVQRLVFVCKGNICRSAYAEAKTRSMGFSAASFGLSADPSQYADPTAVRIATNMGLDLVTHRARTLSQFRLENGDLLVAMEGWQARALQSMSSASGAQVTLLGLWAKKPHPHIEDPYGLSEGYYRNCFQLIDASIDQIVHEIRQVSS